jgi:hypothetical protein
MGKSYLRVVVLLGAGCVLAPSAGCQVQQVPVARLIQHQALIDMGGLEESRIASEVKAHVSPPQRWEALNLKKSPLFIDQQWRSPSKQTGLGIAYVRLPIPLPANALVWLAKKEYAKRGEHGEVLAQWTDDLGRPWFEAQNSLYHVRGYVITRGFEAWVIYCGYKRDPHQPPSAAELGVASRALQKIVPTPLAPTLPQRPIASIPQAGSDQF